MDNFRPTELMLQKHKLRLPFAAYVHIGRIPTDNIQISHEFLNGEFLQL